MKQSKSQNENIITAYVTTGVGVVEERSYDLTTGAVLEELHHGVYVRVKVKPTDVRFAVDPLKGYVFTKRHQAEFVARLELDARVNNLQRQIAALEVELEDAMRKRVRVITKDDFAARAKAISGGEAVEPYPKVRF